jgi:hypothetical protein
MDCILSYLGFLIEEGSTCLRKQANAMFLDYHGEPHNLGYKATIVLMQRESLQCLG